MCLIETHWTLTGNGRWEIPKPFTLQCSSCFLIFLNHRAPMAGFIIEVHVCPSIFSSCEWIMFPQLWGITYNPFRERGIFFFFTIPAIVFDPSVCYFLHSSPSSPTEIHSEPLFDSYNSQEASCRIAQVLYVSRWILCWTPRYFCCCLKFVMPPRQHESDPVTPVELIFIFCMHWEHKSNLCIF